MYRKLGEPQSWFEQYGEQRIFYPYRDEISLSLKYLCGGYLVSRIVGQ